MTQASLVVGSVVELNSGGLSMTVAAVGPTRYQPDRQTSITIPDGFALLVWFDESIQKQATLPVATLKVFIPQS